MSNATPRLVTRTTRREAVVIRLVTVVTEVFEVDAAEAVELPPSVSGMRKTSVVFPELLRVAGSR